MAKGKYRFEQFTATRIYTGSIDYSPDGKQIAHINNATGQFNLWLVPSGGGYPRQLTSYTDNTVRAAIWSRDGNMLVFQADQNGDEFHQLYTISPLGGWGSPITQKMDAQHYLGGFSHDGSILSYAANARDERNVEVVLYHMTTGEKEYPFPSGGGLWVPGDFSRDDRYIIAMKYTSNLNSDVYVLDRQTNELIHCTPHEGHNLYLPAMWSPDGAGFYMLANEGRDFNGLAYYTLADRTWKYVETPNYDIETLSASKDGSILVWVVNEGGASKLYGKNLKTGAALTLPAVPLGQIDNLAVSPDGKRAAMILAQPTEAANLWEIDLATGEMYALGQSMIGGVDPADMVEPELIEFPTFDGRMIPAWLYRPKHVTGQVPVVLSIHGGPDAQERPRYMYNGLYQYLLSKGFGILAPNIRGSTGYGKTYQSLIYRDWGGAELKDIEHAAKYLRSLDWVDTNRIAVYGGSFGGFATLSALTRLPEYWALGVDLVGPSNLITFVQSVPPSWRSMMAGWVGDHEADRDFLIERSPITHVDNIRVPLLVIQGAKDPRVVKAESDQMVERIKANGGDVRYYVDEQEGHGATRRENSIKWMRMVSEYMEEYLLDEPSPN